MFSKIKFKIILKITGILASSFGLSSAIFTQLYKFAFSPNIIYYILFLSIFLGSLTFIGINYFY